MANNRSFFHVHGQVYFVRYVGRHAERMAQHVLNKKHIIISLPLKFQIAADTDEQALVPSSLVEIYKFDQMVRQLERRNKDDVLVFSAGTNTNVQRRVAFLLGCQLIMSKALDAYEVNQIFNDFGGILGQSQDERSSAMNCWQALHQAKALAWVDFNEQFESHTDHTTTIDMEELIHYSRFWLLFPSRTEICFDCCCNA